MRASVGSETWGTGPVSSSDAVEAPRTTPDAGQSARTVVTRRNISRVFAIRASNDEIRVNLTDGSGVVKECRARLGHEAAGSGSIDKIGTQHRSFRGARPRPVTGYLIRRILFALPILLGTATLVFLLVHLVPGDPARAMLGPGPS